MAEQVMRFIGSLGYSRVILKGDGEPSMRMLLEVLQQARLRLGFHRFTSQWSCGERDPDGERHGEDIGARCQRRLSDAHQAIFWAMRHAGWLLTGRKYCGKVAVFGERVLARVKRANGSDKFEPGLWLGKTDRADFHTVATAAGLKWTRTIRRLPTPFDPEAVMYVKFWADWCQSFFAGRQISYGPIASRSRPRNPSRGEEVG